ncbi:unnamed protein product [Owenia fusiformis]|uniref:DUF7164 domain-containing protein n=1 Tax=Owenia fusiformis TaxID=6347 RepID=A0A8J1V0D7_OWEFU|nr:unnamed protein product [Owenia fusiformis]
MANEMFNRINFVYILLGFILSSFLWILWAPINRNHNFYSPTQANDKEKLRIMDIGDSRKEKGIENNDLSLQNKDGYIHQGKTKGKLMEKNNLTIGNKNSEEVDTYLNNMSGAKNEQKNKTSLHNAILMYIDRGDHHVIQFTLFLYASWKYVMSHKSLKGNVTIDNAASLPDIIFDLIVYCHPETCKLLPLDCIPLGKDTILEAVPRCWYTPSKSLQSQPGYPSDYGYLNTFSFLLDDNFSQIANRYDRILRTDTDVFISPAILGWLGKYPLITGQGGYGVPFSIIRLRKIAAKLGLHHQHISDIGSTWYAEPGIFQKVAILALNLSVHFYNHEFNKSLPGLEGIFDTGDDGVWPNWWRQVSTMYGSELAINHLIANLTEDHKAAGYMDMASTDGVTSVMGAPHIHCWHSDIEFNKFAFTDKILQFIKTDVRQLWILNDTKLYRDDMDVSGMSIRQYVTYIAWNGVLKYLPQIVGPMAQANIIVQ